MKWFVRHCDKNASVLFGPVLTVLLLDLFLTVLMQPTAYWEKFNGPDELNIIGRWLLELHPLAFTYAFLGYVVVVYAVMSYARRPLKLFIFFAVSLYHGHAILFGWINTILLNAVVKNLPDENIAKAHVALFIQMVLLFLFSIYMLKTLSKYLNNREYR